MGVDQMFVSILKLRDDYRKYIPNSYEMHRRLWMAFPSGIRPDIIEHSEFLFRQEVERPAVIVQSSIRPDWDKCFRNSEFLLSDPCSVRETNFDYKSGDKLRFVVRVNPTKRLRVTVHASSKKSTRGKRVGIHNEGEIKVWMERQADNHGFSIEKLEIRKMGVQKIIKTAIDLQITAVNVECSGSLIVTDFEKFRLTLHHGFGSGKSIGFGLILTLPV